MLPEIQKLNISWRIVLLATLFGSFASAEDAVSFADLSRQAAAARDANDTVSAVKLYKQALQLNPDWQEGWWMEGSLEYESEHYTDGTDSLRHLLALRPDAGPALALLGLCEYETHNYTDALEHIQRSLKIGVGDQQQMELVLRFHQAALLTRQGEFDMAFQQYSSFVSTEVADRQVLLGLGLTSLRQPETPAEIPIKKTDLFLDAGRALAAWLAHDTEGANAAYRQLLMRYPDEPNVHYAYGYYIFGTDQDRATQEWEHVIQINPSHSAAHSMLAWTYLLHDDQKLASLHAKAALSQDPKSTVALIVQGRVLLEQGQTNAGIASLEQAVSIAPANLEAHLSLATAYSEAGRKADSQKQRRLCVTMQSGAAIVAHP